MLADALRSKVPVIHLTTTDTANIPTVLRHYNNKSPCAWPHKDLVPATGFAGLELRPTWYYYVCRASVPNLSPLRKALRDVDACLVVFNAPEVPDGVLDLGVLEVPKPLLIAELRGYGMDREQAEACGARLSGLTLADTETVYRLTQARDSVVTPNGIGLTRRSLFGSVPGLLPVETSMVFYAPHEGLQAWLDRERHYFLTGTDPRLRPRGLLLAGPPGVGKTLGARYLADGLKLPLYRLDLSGIKEKWVGSSEANMRITLQRLEGEAPCVLLLDEVEKLFHSDDHSTTTSLLAMLLWWLAEHDRRILTVMTSNQPQRLPPELHREGRIDQTLHLKPLRPVAAREFAMAVLRSFRSELPADEMQLRRAVRLLSRGKPVSHAAVTEVVKRYLKATA